MIINLKDNINANRLEIGDKAFYLWKAHNAGVDITDTLIIYNKEFVNFRSTLNLDQKMVEQVQASISRYFPEKCDRIDILSSLAYPCAGICGYIEIERSAPQIKWAIEKIQRSYWDDKAASWRIVNKVSDKEGLPAIIIQPHHDEVFKIVTRSPESGVATNSANFLDAEYSNVQVWSDKYASFLQRIETIMSRPSKVNFYFENDNLVVSSIEEQLIATVHGHLRCLTDLLDSGVINSLTYLMRISPNIIYSLVDFTPAILDQSIRIEGYSLTLGIAGGKLVFPTSDFSLLGDMPYIFATGDFDLDYEPILTKSAGAIGRGGEGGETNHHLAVISRELNIPAVLLGVKFDEDQKHIVLNTGIVIDEFSGTIVNGTQGIVFFNCSGNYFHNMHLTRKFIDNYLLLIIDLLFKHLDPSLFSKLSLEEQKHLVVLLARLRRMNIEYHLKIDELKLY
ncbi:MAG: hypothetical protein U1F76_28525 [Candidatus Competibacteraceae bacterium]